MIYHGSKQADITELTQAIAIGTDPLQIVNAFFRAPPAEIEAMPVSDYWQKRICIMAELFIAVRDNARRQKRKRKRPGR